MKKWIVALCAVLLVFSYAYADVIFHNTNQASVTWDAVTTDIDGDPITGVTYRLYLANADTDPNKTNPVIIQDGITDTNAVITLNTKGRFYAGVSALYEGDESVINWADEIENQPNTEPWALRFGVSPNPPKNFAK